MRGRAGQLSAGRALSLIERGQRVPSLRTLLTISNGFGISLSDLLRGVDSGHKKRRR